MDERAATLPDGARRRLTSELRGRPRALPEIVNSARSVPLVRELWSARLAAIPRLLKHVEEAASPEAFEPRTYEALQASITRLGAARDSLVAMLIALAPFDSRDLPVGLDAGDLAVGEQDASEGAPGLRCGVVVAEDASATATTAHMLRSGLLEAVDRVIDDVLDAIEADVRPPRVTAELANVALPVPTIAVTDRGTALAVAFGMDAVPIDDLGAFSASRVFEAHKYANAPLVSYLMAHMQSFSVEPVDDPLAMVLMTGWIVQATDAVLAWQTLRQALLRIGNDVQAAPVVVTDSDRPRGSGSEVMGQRAGQTQVDGCNDSAVEVLSLVLDHLRDREEALRQSRRVILSATQVLRTTADAEEAAHALADVYRRLVEGPVRQYGWALRCLAAAAWNRLPMVGSLAEAFGPDRWLRAAIVPNLLPDVRNGQAHEALEWDGRRSVYVVEGVDVEWERVDIASANCMSFALGCEAALVHSHALAAEPGATFPTAGQPGRTAAWRRVEALFGTNGLRISSFTFNALRLEAHVERLDREDINPSLQALIHARRLLPHIETFAYFTPDQASPVIEVDARALDANHPVWVHAREHFDCIPLSTFLPANLSARLRHETEAGAAHAVAWIAADCALDAVDGSPPIWLAEDLWLVNARLEHARLALRQTIPMLEEQPALVVTVRTLDQVQRDLGRLLPFTRATEVDQRPSILRLRALWTAWGPVS